MRTNYDFSPLFRSSIGFDHVFDLLQSAARIQAIDNWPPYDIEKTGEDQYRLTRAVAGFSADNLESPSERPITQPNLNDWPEELHHMNLRELADLPLGREPRFRE